MKKLVVILAVLASAACSSDNKNKNNNNNTTGCTTNGNSQCVGTKWQTCNGGSWVDTKDCATTGQQCRQVASLPTAVECYTPVVPAAEFEKCTGSGAGNCTTGLTCLNLQTALGITGVSMCVTECSGVGGCGTRTCDENFGWCVDASGTFGDTCGLNGVGCGSLMCDEYSGYATAWACTVDCAWDAIDTGSTTGCPSVAGTSGSIQTECLEGAFVDVQMTTGTTPAPVGCTAEGNDTGCDTTNGYHCHDVSTGSSTAPYCIRPAGRCGVPVDSTPSFKEADIMDSANMCGIPGALCKPAGTAKADCTAAGYVTVETQQTTATPPADVACTTDSNCDTGYKCLQFSSGKYCARSCSTSSDCSFADGYSCETLSIGKFCSFSLAYCVDFCDNSESCGAGRTCTQITVDCAGNSGCEAAGNSSLFPFPEIELDGTTEVTCANGDGDCNVNSDTGYKCYDLTTYGIGKLCGKAHHVCTTP